MPPEVADEIEEQAAEAVAENDDQQAEALPDADAGGTGGDPPADEVVVTIGDEPEPEDEHRAPDWVRDLRKSSREKDRRIRELESKLATAPAAQVPAVGEKPTYAGCDFDEAKFEGELEAWHERKRQADERKREAEQAETTAKKQWQERLDAYGKAKAALKVKDFDDAEEAARDVLSVVQQGVILDGAERPELLVYALGKNPKKAKELAAITNPTRFAFAVAKLEAELKVTPRSTAPVPEKAVRGSAPVTGSVDTTLQRLRDEAAKTGDLSKVIAYKNAQKAKQRA